MHLARLQIHRAKAGAELLTSVKTVQRAIVMHGGRIVARERVVIRPDRREAIAVDLEERGSRFVRGREKNLSADDEGRRGIDRVLRS